MSFIPGAPISEWRHDILKFAWDNFEFTPDVWQKKAMLAFAGNDMPILRLCLAACAGPGKSCVLSICGLWFMTVMGDRGHHPKGCAVSITLDNLYSGLWGEISLWRAKSELCHRVFEMNSQRLFCRDHPDTWCLFARSFPRSASVDELGKTLSGVHSRFPIFLMDEAGAMPPQLVKTADQALSTEDIYMGRILIAGNPISREGLLYQAARRDTEKWHVVNITGDPDDPDRSPRVSIEWAKEQIKTYGRDDNWVKSYILGQFPDGAVNSLLSESDVEAAMKRHYRIEEYDHAEKRLGVDVAGTGLDLNIFFPRQGLVAFKYSVMRQGKPSDIAARIILAKERWSVNQIFVDSTGGWGSGAIDALGSAGHDCHGINFAEKSVSSRFYNRRAEMWWKMAEWVKRGGCLPNCDYLRRELTEVLYTTKDGKFLIEPKEQLIKRLGYSPDRADALALTFALPELPRSDTLFPMGQQERLKDYDPLAHV